MEKGWRQLARWLVADVPPPVEFTVEPGAEGDGRTVNLRVQARNAAFAPRDGAGALVWSGKMWLLGGWNPADKTHFPRTCNNEVWSSRDGVAWTLEKPNTHLNADFDASRDWEGRHTAGYVVFMPNPRGSTGFGQQFIQGIWGNVWGEQCYRDLMAVADAASPMSYAVYFRANDGAHGTELWRSDGTEAGKVRAIVYIYGSPV